MLGFLNTFTAPARAAANQFLRNQTAAAIKNTGLNTLRTARTGTPLQGYLATLKLSANTPVFKGATAVLAPTVAADVSNRTGFTGQIEGALNKVGPALDQLFSGTPEVIQQYGREQEKKGWGGAFEAASYLMGPGFVGSIVTPTVASLTAPFLPNTQPAPVRRPIANLPADYKQTELAAGAAAEAYRPGAGFPGQQAALDRSYEAEKRRALQLAEQDQLAKKYQVADLTKAYNTAATPEEKQRIGLQIWATTNPQLTQGVKPGQVGYEQAQAAINTPGLDQLSQSQKALLRQAFQQQLNK